MVDLSQALAKARAKVHLPTDTFTVLESIRNEDVLVTQLSLWCAYFTGQADACIAAHDEDGANFCTIKAGAVLMYADVRGVADRVVGIQHTPNRPVEELDRMIEERETFIRQAEEHTRDYPLSDPDPGPVERASMELEELYRERGDHA